MALGFTVLGTREPSPKQEKPHRTPSTEFDSALRIREDGVLWASAKFPHCETRFRTPKNAFLVFQMARTGVTFTATVQWRRALHQSSPCLILMVIIGLYSAARSWKTTSFSSRWTVFVLALLPEAVRNLWHRGHSIFAHHVLQHMPIPGCPCLSSSPASYRPIILHHSNASNCWLGWRRGLLVLVQPPA